MSEATEIVPLNEAVLADRIERAKLINGRAYALSGDRKIEVWRVEGHDGFCIRIFRPTDDGKTAKLVFGLSDDAAVALMLALSGAVNRSPEPLQPEAA